MILAFGDAKGGAGALLPMLVAADAMAMVYYRRHARFAEVVRLFPAVLVGIGGGAVLLDVSDGGSLRYVVGAIILAMLAFRIRDFWRGFLRKGRESQKTTPKGAGQERLRSVVFGVCAGMATTIANSAGPIMSLYLLGRRLPKAEFMGIKTWFFFCVNLVKLPLYGYLGMLSADSLALNLQWLPAIVVGALVGRRLFLVSSQRGFEGAVLGLTAASTVLLLIR